MTLLPQVRSQLDSAAERQSTESVRRQRASSRSATVTRLVSDTRWSGHGGRSDRRARDGAGAIALLGHRHKAAQASVSRPPTSASIPLPAPIRGRLGQPIVITVWATRCPPCRADLSLAATVASHYVPRISFIAADYKDVPRLARGLPAGASHHVGELPGRTATALVPARLRGVPATIFVNGRVV